MKKQAFSGYERARRTRFSVRLGEVLSRLVITVGGIGTIVSVGLIMVFLVLVVLPLFRGARVDPAGSTSLAEGVADVRQLVVDEYRLLCATVDGSGHLVVQRLDDGEVLDRGALFESEPTASAWAIDGSSAVFGFADGSVRFVELGFVTEFLAPDAVPEALASLAPAEVVTYEGGVVQLTPERELRRQTLRITVAEPVQVADEPIRLLDRTASAARSVLCVLTESGRLRLAEVSERKNLLTGKVTFTATETDIPFDPPAELGTPWDLRLTGAGDQILVLWRTGEALRIDARDRANPTVAESLDLCVQAGVELTQIAFLVGRSTLVAGDTSGAVTGWFTTQPDGADTVDGRLLTEVHRLSAAGPAVTAIAPSTRSRMVSVGYADGSVRLFQMTTARELAVVVAEGGAAIEALELVPKEDGLVCLAGGSLQRFDVDPRYPEAGMAAIFEPVWYEGYPRPEHVWQSTGGTDEFEPKLGLVPLVFGTLKATFYSLLFGAPIALLAAIYTSEFLNRRYRTPVKSVIEVMASLPSVVLGFLAALVIAPFVQDVLAGTLALFLTIPVSLLLGAYLWQMLPRPLTLRLEGGPRLAVIAAALVAAVWLAARVGPAIEHGLFGGDVELWLDGQVGGGTAGWFFLLLPLCGVAVALSLGALLNPLLRVRSAGWSHRAAALVSFLKFVCGAIAAALLALGLGKAFVALGWDPREDFFGLIGTYVQRNALVVGFVMGFAIIPIIYTLAEDALSSVPEHLRHASLGAGATPWQTAIRVVVPTATSGLFSALMIGLGRAVGETMIVLMATGNTPVMEMNVFNGFRTLSANIAVELPEAVKDSAHYRTLFLAALVLFAMTFCLNTLAELVRQRFRKRAVQL